MVKVPLAANQASSCTEALTGTVIVIVSGNQVSSCVESLSSVVKVPLVGNKSEPALSHSSPSPEFKRLGISREPVLYLCQGRSSWASQGAERGRALNPSQEPSMCPYGHTGGLLRRIYGGRGSGFHVRRSSWVLHRKPEVLSRPVSPAGQVGSWVAAPTITLYRPRTPERLFRVIPMGSISTGVHTKGSLYATVIGNRGGVL